MLTASIQSASLAVHWPAYRRFRAALQAPRAAQEAVLARLLARASATETGRSFLGERPPRTYREFAERCPVSSYSDWAPSISAQQRAPKASILSPDCARYEPTSGSTDQRKWIPYSSDLLAEFDRAASAWLFDLGTRFPGVRRGRHYWSLSWVPDELRGQAQTDDVQVFPAWKRAILSRIMAVPRELARLPTLRDSFFATLAYLSACRDLALISVWSPTFALELLRGIEAHRNELAEILAAGKWNLPLRAPHSPEAARILRGSSSGPELYRNLWPSLSLLSCWESSSSSLWAAQLRELFPGVPLQGKGLWATEGVVTIPFAGTYPLAIHSHFLEFRCLTTNRVHPAWELEEGQKLQPILTTGSGFLRYALQDEMEVTGRLERTPCLRFTGRLGGIDLVGEKLNGAAALGALERLSREMHVRCVSLLARPGPGRPRYIVLAEGRPEVGASLAARLEHLLCEYHHYRLARELGQLDPAEAIVRPDALHFYLDLRAPSAVAGAGKVEPLILWKERAPS